MADGSPTNLLPELDPADYQGEDNTTTIAGDYVSGDKVVHQTAGGDIIGRDKVTHYSWQLNLQHIPLLIALLSLVGVLVYRLWQQSHTGHMPEASFNVAVAEFSVVDENDTAIQSTRGRELGIYVANQLKGEFEALGWSAEAYEVWDPTETGPPAGQDPEHRSVLAERLAARIQADIVIYGVVYQEGDHARVTPEYYVDYQGFDSSSEITGQHELGTPVPVDFPVDIFGNPALVGSVRALCLLTVGLAQYSLDDFAKAIELFSLAEASPGWRSDAGKEVVYLLLGNAYTRLASKQHSLEPIDLALEQYEAALGLNPEYARAMIGMASAMYLQALGTDPGWDTVSLSRLQNAETAYETALHLNDAPESANVSNKVHFGLGQIYFVRSQIQEGNWLARAQAEFDFVVAAYERGDQRSQDLAGHSYARLGSIALTANDNQTAIEHYQRAVELVSRHWKAVYSASIAEIYARQGDVDQAVAAYRDAVFFADENEQITKYSQRLNELTAQQEQERTEKQTEGD